MMLLSCVTLLAAFAPFAHLHPHCPNEKAHLLPAKLSEIQGTWHLISSAYQKEDKLKEDKQATFAWMEIATVDGVTKMKHVVGIRGRLSIIMNLNVTFLEEDGCVSIKDHVHNLTSEVHKMSDDCMMWTINHHTETNHNIGDIMFCRSHSGNDADVEAFKKHSQCKNLHFTVERRSHFNYVTECDSVSHLMDPLDPHNISGRWHMVARATYYPEVMFEGKNPWLEFSLEEEKLVIHEGRDDFSCAEEDVEVKGHTIITGKEKKNYMEFYRDCKECLLMRTEDHHQVAALHLMTLSGKFTSSQMKTFHDSSRCLTLPVLYRYEGAELHEEEASHCDAAHHIVDPLDPSKITGKWQLVGKATMDSDAKHHEEPDWMNLSWDGEKLKIEEGSDTLHLSVREVKVTGSKIFDNETGADIMLIPTCKDCMLMKSVMPNKKIELHFLTRSGEQRESEITTFRVNAHCLHLHNVHVYEHAKPHVTECDSLRHLLDVFVPDQISGKWHMVAKAHSQPGKMEEEDDPWIEYSCDGHNLTIHEGRGKHSWPVKDVEVRGPKIVIQKENSVYITFHPTCPGCLLMKADDHNKEVVLHIFTRSGKLADSEIKTFKDKAHCLHLSNVIVYKSATLHEEKGETHHKGHSDEQHHH
ncbi:uncharacterized protein LOC144756282 isoform X1 [Lissotriton helveticus]